MLTCPNGSAFFLGVIMAAGTLGALAFGTTATHGATLAFTTFVLFQVVNVFNDRAEHGTAFTRQLFTNMRLWFALVTVVTLQVGVVYWSPLQQLFGTVALSALDWARCAGIAGSVLVAEELRKVIVAGLWVARRDPVPTSRSRHVHPS